MSRCCRRSSSLMCKIWTNFLRKQCIQDLIVSWIELATICMSNEWITISDIKWEFSLFAPLERLITHLSWCQINEEMEKLTIKIWPFFSGSKIWKISSPLQTLDEQKKKVFEFEFRIFFHAMKNLRRGWKKLLRIYQISIFRVGLNFSFHAAIFSLGARVEIISTLAMSASWQCHWFEWISSIFLLFLQFEDSLVRLLSLSPLRPPTNNPWKLASQRGPIFFSVLLFTHFLSAIRSMSRYEHCHSFSIRQNEKRNEKNL